MEQRAVAIYVIGPSSTGKTTLCNALAKKLAIPEEAYVTEIARKVMKEKGYSRHTVGQLQMQQDILTAYLQREIGLDTMNSPARLFDRSAIDPIVYAVLTSKDEEEVEERKKILMDTEEFRRVLGQYRSNSSVVVLLAPIPEWQQDDGVRSMEKQGESFQIFQSLLQELKIGYRQLGPASMFLEERVASVLGWAGF